MQSLLSRKAAAQMLGVSVHTIGRLVAAGSLPAYRIGGLVRIAPNALERYLESQLLSGKEANNESANNNACASGAAADASNAIA